MNKETNQLFNTEAEYVAAGQVACEYLLSRDQSFFFQPTMLPDHGDLDTMGAGVFGIGWNDACYDKLYLIVSRMRDTIRKQIEVVQNFYSILPPDCAKCGGVGTWELYSTTPVCRIEVTDIQV